MAPGERPDAAADAATTGDDSTPVLRVDGVSKSFGDVDVFEDVSFAIERGGVTAVVGPNGSGKTTLAELVAGVDHPDAGTVDLTAGGPRPVGYLPQAPAFRPSETVAETLSFYARQLPDPEPVDDALDRVGLGGVPDRRVDALSGGMRRLLGIAVSLIGEPPVLVLDEPTSGLDPQMTARVFDTIEAQSGEDRAVVLTTHDLSQAAKADLVLVLAHGGVEAIGPPDQLIEDSDAEDLHGAFDALVGASPLVEAGGDERE